MPNPAVPSLDDLPDFLTIGEAATILRIGRSAAYELASRWRFTHGREGLPVVQLGRSIRVPKAGILRLLSEAISPESKSA